MVFHGRHGRHFVYPHGIRRRIVPSHELPSVTYFRLDSRKRQRTVHGSEGTVLVVCTRGILGELVYGCLSGTGQCSIGVIEGNLDGTFAPYRNQYVVFILAYYGIDLYERLAVLQGVIGKVFVAVYGFVLCPVYILWLSPALEDLALSQRLRQGSISEVRSYLYVFIGILPFEIVRIRLVESDMYRYVFPVGVKGDVPSPCILVTVVDGLTPGILFSGVSVEDEALPGCRRIKHGQGISACNLIRAAVGDAFAACSDVLAPDDRERISAGYPYGLQSPCILLCDEAVMEGYGPVLGHGSDSLTRRRIHPSCKHVSGPLRGQAVIRLSARDFPCLRLCRVFADYIDVGSVRIEAAVGKEGYLAYVSYNNNSDDCGACIPGLTFRVPSDADYGKLMFAVVVEGYRI